MVKRKELEIEPGSDYELLVSASEDVTPVVSADVPRVPPFLRTPYNYDMSRASDVSGLKCEDASRTSQEFAQEVDINTIVEQFGLTGKLPEGVRAPVYGDFTGISNYHDAANAIALANESFEAMPAEVRARFSNDPGKFVDFAVTATPEQLHELGMVDPVKWAESHPKQEVKSGAAEPQKGAEDAPASSSVVSS